MAGSPPQPTQIAVAVVERDGCYLVGQRPPGSTLAGYWEFPGGKVEAGETVVQAAARECLEEAGLAVSVQAVYSTVDHEYKHGHLRLTFLACKPLDRTAEPTPPYAWRPAAELAELSFPPANSAIVKQLLAAAACL
ncbi:MAG TPA: (deoxy)nucleoside triphosphate pyrophosphohydrolase [Pirellulales bacterium]|nr:(deoxy)nucleoside triphosphate pyrophosphohydrolase [Pirellulales bacterium]